MQRNPKIGIDKSHTIVDSGATAIFVMESAPVDNKRVAQRPLTISLPDGTKVKSTHECDITHHYPRSTNGANRPHSAKPNGGLVNWDKSIVRSGMHSNI